MQQHNINRLGKLVRCLQHGEPLSTDVRLWLLGGIQNALHRDERLDVALGLAGQTGKRTLQTRLQLHQRDEHLRAALHLVAFDNVGPWERALRLAEVIRRFTGFEWPRCKYASEPPERLSAIERELWHAARTDQRLPGAHGLWRIARAPDYWRERDGVKLLANQL